MNDPDLYTGTWSRRGGMAMWAYRLPLTSNESAVAELRDASARLLSHLEGFAAPAVASWSTLSEGEDARVMADQPITVASLKAGFEELGDATELVLDLDLLVLALSGAEARIPRAATIRVELDSPDGELPEARDPELRMRLSLDVDIYAPVGYGGADNRALAALNASRLTRFLKRLREDIGATFTDAESDRGHRVGSEGFLDAP